MRWIGVGVFVPASGGGCVAVAFCRREVLCVIGGKDDTIFAEVGEKGCGEWNDAGFEGRRTVSGIY